MCMIKYSITCWKNQKNYLCKLFITKNEKFYFKKMFYYLSINNTLKIHYFSFRC